jgi:uncharacterized protein
VTASGAPSAFVPGGHPISAHGGFAFAFAGMRHEGSILATPRGVRPLAVASAADMGVAELSELFDEAAATPGAIEFVVFGTGAQMIPLAAALRAALREAGLRFEAMATGPALRVYNVMQTEGRRVAAALIAAP